MARGFNYAPGASADVAQAAQPGLHKTHIMALGASRNALVRATVAARTDCPLGLMVTLAHDYSADVRAAVARNPSAQRTVMAYLSTDRSVDVLKGLLENPALPAEILEELAFHKKAEVRSAAATRLDVGLPAQTAATREDSATPELAEHVIPVPQEMTAHGTVVPTLEPGNVVDIATREPVTTPDWHFSGLVGATPAPESQTEVPQIFSPHSRPGAPAPTRTAPVRGFKPKQ